MPYALPTDKTRIFLDRQTVEGFTDIHLLHRCLHRCLHTQGIEDFEVFAMATSIGIDCRTLDLLKVAGLLKGLELI